jgi:hypothetical protein
MRNLLMVGTTGLVLALGMVGAKASDVTAAPRYATALPDFFSSRSPLMADHYGYDDRDTTVQMTEGRAAYVDRAATPQPRFEHGAMANP